MANREAAEIYRLSAVCAFMAAMAFIVPRFVANPEAGFAGGASAIATLLMMLGAALAFPFYLLAATLKHYGNLLFTDGSLRFCDQILL